MIFAKCGFSETQERNCWNHKVSQTLYNYVDFPFGGFVEVIAAGVSQQNKLQCISDRGFTGACLTG